MFLRLRQLCLVAEKLDPVVDALADVFAVVVCHRDPEVGQFGLHNALLPFGTSFVEVVAPIAPGTTAARYLDRRHGDGGYMVILDSDELPRWRRHVASIGVRIAAPLKLGDYEGAQLHPRDTGGALLEINTTVGGDDIHGAYWPAGPHWRESVRTHRVAAITGAVLQSDDPLRLSQRWAEILQRNAVQTGAEWHVHLDNSTLRFVQTADGRGEGLAGIDLKVADRGAILAAARSRGLPNGADTVDVGGVRFRLD